MSNLERIKKAGFVRQSSGVWTYWGRGYTYTLGTESINESAGILRGSRLEFSGLLPGSSGGCFEDPSRMSRGNALRLSARDLVAIMFVKYGFRRSDSMGRHTRDWMTISDAEESVWEYGDNISCCTDDLQLGTMDVDRGCNSGGRSRHSKHYTLCLRNTTISPNGMLWSDGLGWMSLNRVYWGNGTTTGRTRMNQPAHQPPYIVSSGKPRPLKVTHPHPDLILFTAEKLIADPEALQLGLDDEKIGRLLAMARDEGVRVER